MKNFQRRYTQITNRWLKPVAWIVDDTTKSKLCYGLKSVVDDTITNNSCYGFQAVVDDEEIERRL